MSEELSEQVDELIFWLKYSMWKPFITDLRVNLKDDVEKMIYQLSNGNRSTRDIVKILLFNGKTTTHVTVANLWQKWASVPIVIRTNKSGRYKRVVSLRAAGIEYPDIKLPTDQEERDR